MSRLFWMIVLVGCAADEVPEEMPELGSCEQYVSCMGELSSELYGQATTTFGPDGLCWSSGEPETCHGLCEDGLEDVMDVHPELRGEAACGAESGVPGEHGVWELVFTELATVCPNGDRMEGDLSSNALAYRIHGEQGILLLESIGEDTVMPCVDRGTTFSCDAIDRGSMQGMRAEGVFSNAHRVTITYDAPSEVEEGCRVVVEQEGSWVSP